MTTEPWQRDVRTILALARERYAENPSHAPRGEFTDHCPVVCIDRVSGGDSPEAERLLAEAAGIGEFEGFVRLAIIEWNAEASTEEVLAAFDRAIKAAA